MRAGRAVAAALVLAASAASVAAGGCGGDATSKSGDPFAAPTPGASMTGREGPLEKVPCLVLVGETLGWVEPCGCAEGMMGGLPRLASFVKALRTRGYEPAVLSLGDLVTEPSRQSELKLDTIYAAFDRIGVSAFALGENDLAMGRDLLAEHLRDRTIAVLAANVAPAEATPSPQPSPLGEREPVRAHDVEVVAYLSPAFGPDVAALTGGAWTVKSIPSGSDTFSARTVVLYHGPRDEAAAAFKDRKDVLVVYAGHGEEYPTEPTYLPGGALLVSTGDKGKYAAVIELRRDPATGAIRAEPGRPQAMFPLGDRVPDDPDVAALVDAYKTRLFEEDLVSTLERKPPESGGRFLGPEACASCHKPQYAIYEGTKHAHAFESLVPRKGTRDPECLRCHSTGFGFASGFEGVERSPHLAKVSCETCHGVGSNHAENPIPGTFGKIPDPRLLCVECHDKENSPSFDFDRYWPRIRH